LIEIRALAFLLRVHDWLARAFFVIASVALVAATSLFLFEVAARYIFAAPTAWSSEYIRYCLVAIIFMALPEMTRQKAHIAIEIVPEYLSRDMARLLGNLNLMISAVVSGVAGWIVGLEVLKQFESGLMTNAAFPIQRYPLTALIAFGFLGASSFFLRQIFDKREHQ
jgi:TRAP-type C4-dicarboxylate transport system permease small subunit